MIRLEGSDVAIAERLYRSICAASDELRFVTIPGAPASKARPRFGRGKRTYIDKESRAAEQRTAQHLRLVFDAPLTGNIAIACVFYRPNRQRIDADNMLKHVLDAANTICWRDDSQVTAVLGLVEYDPANPRTIVIVGTHESTLDRAPTTYACERCGREFDVPAGTRPRKYCGRACQGTKRAKLAEPVPCPVCGTPFVRRTTSQKTCSVACARRSVRGVPRPEPTVHRCRDCGEPVSKAGYIRCRACWATARAEDVQA